MRRRDIGAAVLVTAVWGVNFSVIKLGLQNVDPFVLAALRFLLCAVPAVFFIKKPDLPFRFLAAYGLLFGVGLWGVVNLSIVAGLSAGIASLLLQFSALFTLLLGALVFRESVTPWQWRGLSIAAAGLLSAVLITDGSVTYLGVVLVLAAAVSWSAANIVIKKAHPDRLLAFLLWSSLFSPLPLLMLDVAFHGFGGLRALPAQLDGKTISSILFQVYPVTIFGYSVWNSLLKRYPVSAVAPLSLLVPVFGLAGSVLIFHEAVPVAKITALALIVGGVVVGLYGPRALSAAGVVAARWSNSNMGGTTPKESGSAPMATNRGSSTSTSSWVAARSASMTAPSPRPNGAISVPAAERGPGPTTSALPNLHPLSLESDSESNL